MTALAPRPGYAVISGSSQSPTTPPTSTGTWFPAGLTEKGPLVATKVSSLADFEGKFGKRLNYAILYDCMEEYFGDGGTLAYVSRVVGPAAVVAHGEIKDAGAIKVFEVTAKGPGAYYNSIKVKPIVVGETFKFQIRVGTLLVEESPTFTEHSSAVMWASIVSQYINIALGTSVLAPTETEVTLASGNDDHANATNANWVTALAQFVKNLGPGQVSTPGRTTLEAYEAVILHAINFNRFGLLDLPNSPTVATVTGVPISVRGNEADTYGMAFGPWLQLPAPIKYTYKEVPPCALAAAKIARNDNAGLSPNRPAANKNGVSIRAIGLTQPPYEEGTGTEVTRDAMYSKGCNLLIQEGPVFIYGWRTFVDPEGPRQDWLNAGNARLRMAIVARASVIAKNYVLNEIDGQGKILSEFEGELSAMLATYWRRGSLFGATASEAFQINVGPSINTPESLANLELKAEISLRMSPDAEFVTVVVTKVPIYTSLVTT